MMKEDAGNTGGQVDMMPPIHQPEPDEEGQNPDDDPRNWGKAGKRPIMPIPLVPAPIPKYWFEAKWVGQPVWWWMAMGVSIATVAGFWRLATKPVKK